MLDLKDSETKSRIPIKGHIMILTLIIIVQICFFVSAGISKKGFFVDELWTFGLSNSYYHPHIYSGNEFTSDQYLSPEYFRDYLEVTGDDAFSYGSVMYNQEQDIHPPLFYIVLHTVCSIFKNQFSKWFGIIPNLFYYTVAALALYRLSQKLLKNDYAALAPVIIWGFSTQTVSYAILIRMYMMFAMFAVLDCLNHSDYLLEGKAWTKRRWAGLYLITDRGCLTQYYYYIFAFFLSAVTSLVMWSKKQWKLFLCYAGVMFSGILTAWVIFPGIIRTFLYDKGKDSVEGLFAKTNYAEPLKGYLLNLQDKMFYGLNRYLVLIALVCVILCLVLYIPWERVNMLFWAVAAAVLFYMLTVIKIAPWITDRYYFAVTPCIWLLLVYFVCQAMRGSVFRVTAGLILVLGISLFSDVQGYRDGKIMYQFPRQEEVMDKLKEYEGMSCIFVINGREYTATAHALELQNFSEIKLIDLARKPLMDWDIHHETPFLVAYVDDWIDQNEIINQISQKTGYMDCALLGRGSGIWWEDAEELYIYVFH